MIPGLLLQVTKPGVDGQYIVRDTNDFHIENTLLVMISIYKSFDIFYLELFLISEISITN